MQSDQLLIRSASDSDLPALIELYAQLAVGSETVIPLDRARQILARIKSYPDYDVYVAELGGRVVGTFALLIMDNLAHHGAPSAVVEDVVVSADVRSRGIGRQMMEFAMAKCRAAGCYKLALSSNARREAAHRFYESLGFNQHGYSYLIEFDR